jgi:hypothetical protein
VKKYEVEFNKAAISLADQMTNPQQKKATMNRLLKVAWVEGGGGRLRVAASASAFLASHVPHHTPLTCHSPTHAHTLLRTTWR